MGNCIRMIFASAPRDFRGRFWRFGFRFASRPSNGLGCLARRRARGTYSDAARSAASARYKDGGFWTWRQPCVICMPQCEQISMSYMQARENVSNMQQKNDKHTQLKEGERLFLAVEYINHVTSRMWKTQALAFF